MPQLVEGARLCFGNVLTERFRIILALLPEPSHGNMVDAPDAIRIGPLVEFEVLECASARDPQLVLVQVGEFTGSRWPWLGLLTGGLVPLNKPYYAGDQ